MAYTAVPTLSTGYLVTAADWNTYVKDNFAAGVPDIFTSKGDLAVGATGGDIAARVGVGSNGQVFTADSAQTYGVKWADITVAGAVARYTNGNTQTIATATATIIDYETEVYDPDTAVTVGAAWKYTCQTDKDGYYLVVASLRLQASANWAANEYARLKLYKNNSEYGYLGEWVCQAGNTQAVPIIGATFVQLAATDYIDVRLLHNSGSDETVDSDANACHVAISKVYIP